MRYVLKEVGPQMMRAFHLSGILNPLWEYRIFFCAR
jgi:hypothetical protein